jgi:hypothetical protein
MKRSGSRCARAVGGGRLDDFYTLGVGLSRCFLGPFPFAPPLSRLGWSRAWSLPLPPDAVCIWIDGGRADFRVRASRPPARRPRWSLAVSCRVRPELCRYGARAVRDGAGAVRRGLSCAPRLLYDPIRLFARFCSPSPASLPRAPPPLAEDADPPSAQLSRRLARSPTAVFTHGRCSLA